MWSRLQNGWYLLTGNLWFKPFSFSLLIFALMLAVSLVDYHFHVQETPLGILYSAKLSVAQDIAVSLMTAMMTMTTLVISITMVVLSLATSQMGPRLIQTFVSDRKTQSYIGLFFGSVVATFYLVRVTHSHYFTDDLLPVLSITATVLYCFATLFILLFFINHVATACMADTIINKVSEDLFEDIERVYSASHLLGSMSNVPRSLDRPKEYKTELFSLCATKEGYIQNVAAETLLKKTPADDLFIEIDRLAGAHVLKGQVLARVYRAKDMRANDEKEALRRSLENSFTIGERRTRSQDVGYSIRHLVEIALRALSPGINDPFTAFKVIDKLGQGILCLADKTSGVRILKDEEDTPRVAANGADLSEMIALSFDQIREAAASRLDVNMHMIAVIERIAAQAGSNKDLRKALKDQIQSISEIADRLSTNEQRQTLRNGVKGALQKVA
ncbi:MAG: DUF2254 domain-containing protein [Pseudobdellovibrionaceae bacterium]